MLPSSGEQPSEIDKAIDLLIALKSARPKSFEDAMARIGAAKDPDDERAHASSLVLGLLKGSFGRESSRMLADLCPKLPTLPSGALALRPAGSPEASSLASRAMRLHGLAGSWTRFFMQSIMEGSMPPDPDCAFDVLCRIAETLDDPDEGSGWLGHPDAFHESLGAFFAWRLDWRALAAQTQFDPLPWIVECWLHEGSAASFGLALRSCRHLMAAGAFGGTTPSAWLEFARPSHAEHAEASLAAMRECLSAFLPELAASGASPCHMFCRHAYPTPWMGRALCEVLRADPGGAARIDADGLSCLYWINARVAQHDSRQWQDPLLECFSILVEAGADPRTIAPQVPLASIAKHPSIAAAVEAAEISSGSAPGKDAPCKSL